MLVLAGPGCSGSGGGGGGQINVTTEEAQAQVAGNVGETFGGAVGAVGVVALDAQLLGVLGGILGDESGFPQDPDGLDTLVSGLTQGLADLFDALLRNPVRNGNTITYTPDAAAVCAQVPLGTEQNCADILGHVTLLQTLTSDTTGTLQFRFDGVTAATLGYSPTETWFEVDLAGLKAALGIVLGILDPTATLDLPSTFQGAVRIMTSTPAPGTGTVTLAITREIRIAGPVDCGNMSVVLGATNKLLQMTVDEEAGTATFEANLAGVDVQIPFEDDADGCHTATLNLGGLTALLQINASSQNLVLTDVGIGGMPLVLDVDGDEALRVELDTFGMTVNGDTGAIRMDTGFHLLVNLSNVQAFFETIFGTTDPAEGSVTANMPAGTRIELLENAMGETLGTVTGGGPIDVTGTGEFSGDESIAMDECFILFPELQLFPIESADCP
jgi:hypothetical protein